MPDSMLTILYTSSFWVITIRFVSFFYHLHLVDKETENKGYKITRPRATQLERGGGKIWIKVVCLENASLSAGWSLPSPFSSWFFRICIMMRLFHSSLFLNIICDSQGTANMSLNMGTFSVYRICFIDQFTWSLSAHCGQMEQYVEQQKHETAELINSDAICGRSIATPCGRCEGKKGGNAF